jgi:hypothetical protein
MTDGQSISRSGLYPLGHLVSHPLPDRAQPARSPVALVRGSVKGNGRHGDRVADKTTSCAAPRNRGTRAQSSSRAPGGRGRAEKTRRIYEAADHFNAWSWPCNFQRLGRHEITIIRLCCSRWQRDECWTGFLIRISPSCVWNWSRCSRCFTRSRVTIWHSFINTLKLTAFCDANIVLYNALSDRPNNKKEGTRKGLASELQSPMRVTSLDARPRRIVVLYGQISTSCAHSWCTSCGSALRKEQLWSTTYTPLCRPGSSTALVFIH